MARRVAAVALILGLLIVAPGFDARVQAIHPDEPGPRSRAGSARSAPSLNFVPREVLVRFRPGVSERIAHRLLARVSASSSSLWGPRGIHRLRLPPGIGVEKALRTLRSSGLVARAEPNVLFQLEGVSPDDPLFGEQWGLSNSGQSHSVADPPPTVVEGLAGADANVVEAWDTTVGSDDVVVAVIDSGVDLSHPDLSGRLWVNPGEQENGKDDDGNGKIDDVNGYDFFDDDGDPSDSFGHGTEVAGVLSATIGNGLGIAGVCPGCRIMVLRTGNGMLRLSSILEAISYATSMGADVINMSFAAVTWSMFERKAIAAAGARGVLSVAAAGNQARDNDGLLWADGEPIGPAYPASYELESLVSVAASNDHDEYAYETGCAFRQGGDPEGCYFTNWGSESVDLAAPGVDIVTTDPGDYVPVNGTSFAAPFVAGIAGLLKSVHPEYSAEELRAALVNSVDRPSTLSGFPTFTDGRVNAEAALSASTVVEARPSDGSIAGARPIGGSRSARLDDFDDVNDVYQRRLVEGSRYLVRLDVPAGVDFDLYVWRPGTRDVWPVDMSCGFSCALVDAGVGGRGRGESVVVRARASGSYYFVVTAVSGRGRYTLEIGVAGT
jgi:subtilisin family serine protease